MNGGYLRNMVTDMGEKPAAGYAVTTHCRNVDVQSNATIELGLLPVVGGGS
jgi:hypothetical protein